MDKIKVYLQYPWKFPDSPYYKNLLQEHPKSVEYLNVKKQKGVLTSSRKLFFSHEFKRTVRRFIRIFRIPILNAHLTKSKEKYDLIHCAHCLSRNKGVPWIADFEGMWQIYFENKSERLKRKLRKIMLRKECRKILPWTKDVEDGILKEFPELKDKMEVVYPAIPMPRIKRKKHKGINLLFVGRYFFRKGGLHALEAMDRLTKKYKDVSGIFVSDVPEELLRKYSKNKKIKFYKLMPQEKLFQDVYAVSDIFIYPGYRDSFGFAFLEAMSFGIPVVTLNGFARKEIIQNSKTGFVIDKKIPKPDMKRHREDIVTDIVKETEKMIKNRKLLNKMSKNSIEWIKDGRFSIKERNRKMERIYKEALN